MPFGTELMQRLDMAHPVIQAPLAGGGDTPELVAAVGEAGALGFIGAAYLTPQQILEASRAVRGRTARPFGISLFAPQPAPPAPKDPKPALERVAPFYAELDLPPPQAPTLASDAFAEQLTAALESGAAVFSFTFSFGGEFEAGMVGTVSLVPQVVDAVRIPVIASGGIMDGRGIAAALALGADAVQMGTAFLDRSRAPR